MKPEVQGKELQVLRDELKKIKHISDERERELVAMTEEMQEQEKTLTDKLRHATGMSLTCR